MNLSILRNKKSGVVEASVNVDRNNVTYEDGPMTTVAGKHIYQNRGSRTSKGCSDKEDKRAAFGKNNFVRYELREMSYLFD